MAVRNDLTIDWESSPRIITVDAPSVEITMQDLLDSLRSEEAKLANMDNEPIVDAAGKEDLGSGVKVGVTVTLQNALLAFEARGGPSWIQCIASGGNLVAIDDIGDSISSIHPTAYTQVVLSSSSSATLSDVVGASEVADAVWAASEGLQVLADLAFIKKIEGGKWEIVNNQMIFYEEDNLTEVTRFNLFNKDGDPAMTDIYKREKV